MRGRVRRHDPGASLRRSLRRSDMAREAARPPAVAGTAVTGFAVRAPEETATSPAETVSVPGRVSRDVTAIEARESVDARTGATVQVRCGTEAGREGPTHRETSMPAGGSDPGIAELQPGATTEPGTRGDVRLVGRRCTVCGVRCFPARMRCVSCFSDRMERVELNRIGKVDAFTVAREAPPGYHGPVPYVLGQVVFDNDIVALSHLVGKPVDDWRRGDIVASYVLELPAGGKRVPHRTFAFYPASPQDLAEAWSPETPEEDMGRAFVIGIGLTAFARHPDRSVEDLAAEAIIAACADAGVEWRRVEQFYAAHVNYDGGRRPAGSARIPEDFSPASRPGSPRR